MDLTLLQSFLVVCRTGHVSLAAEILHRAQSTVSKHIASLEEVCGVPLFDRSERPWKLTEPGRVFQHFAQESVHRHSELNRVLKEIAAGVQGECRVGATTSLGTFLLSPILSRLVQKNRSLEVSIHARPRRVIYESVRQGEVQFAVVLTEEPPKGLLANSLRKEHFCLVTSSEHDVPRGRPVPRDQLNAMPLVTGIEGTFTTALSNKFLTQVGLDDHKVAFRVSNIEGIKEVLLSGFGSAALPYYAVKKELDDGLLKEIPVPRTDWRARIMVIERPESFCLPSTTLVRDFIARNIDANDLLT